MAIRDMFFKKKSEEPSYGAPTNFKNVVDYFVKENPAEKIVFEGVGKALYGTAIPPTNYDNPIAAFIAYPVAYSVITAISDAVAGLSIKVYEVKGGQRTEVTDHLMYQIFSNPNPYQGSFEFLEEIEQTADVCGNIFIYKEQVKGTWELYNLNPKYVAIIPDGKTKVKGYRFYISGKYLDFDPEEIIHIKYNNPNDPYYGLPPLAVAANVLTFEKNRMAFANNYFINGAIPVGVLETEQVLGEVVLKKLRGEWTNIHGGVGKSHKVGILQGGLKYKPITSPLKDLDFPGLKKLSKDDILSIYKVPESILGSQAGTGSDEGKGAITAFWRQCVIPRLKRIESGLNKGLFSDVLGEGKFVIEFNLKDIAALQDDKQEVASYLSTLVQSSILTVNEARAQIGQPKSTDPNADILLVSNSAFGNALMPVSEVGNQGAGSTDPKPGAKPSGTTPVKPKPKK